MNTFHPYLKFTHDKSKVSINFLDATVSIIGEEFETDLYCKPIDCHQFLEFNSAHNKKAIVYSQGLRIKRYNLKNTLKVYLLGLASMVVPKNLLTIKLGGFLKENQNCYLKVAQRLGLAYLLL